MLDAADRQIMLEATGVTATLPGGQTLLVAPAEYPEPQVMYSGGDVVSVNPYAHAAKEDIASLGITGGESGTVLTIDGQDFRVLSIKTGSSGFVDLELGTI